MEESIIHGKIPVAVSYCTTLGTAEQSSSYFTRYIKPFSAADLLDKKNDFGMVFTLLAMIMRKQRFTGLAFALKLCNDDSPRTAP